MLRTPRTMLIGLWLLAALLPGALSGSVAHAVEILSTVTQISQLPPLPPRYQIPDEPNQLLFLHRSGDPDTVVYAARLTSKGALDPQGAVEAYWRRYNMSGQREPLEFFIRSFVYGVVAEPVRANTTKAHIVSYPERSMSVELSPEGRPRGVIEIEGRRAQLIYVYLNLDETGTIPAIVHVDIYARDLARKQLLHERLTPANGPLAAKR